MKQTTNNPTLTPKKLTVLILLYRFRFLTTRHFQTIFNHKDPHRIKTWLKELTQKQYIHSNYNRKTIPENTKPAIFCLDLKSRKILKNHRQCDPQILKRIYTEKGRSKQFTDHCLFLADIYVQLMKVTQEPKTLHFFTRVDITNYDSLPTPKPDGYIAIKNPQKKTQRYFLDIFDDGTPFFVMKRRIKTYVDYVDEGIWQKQTEDLLPSVLLVVPSEKIKKYLYRHITRTYEDELETISFFLTTKETMTLKGLEINVWEKVE